MNSLDSNQAIEQIGRTELSDLSTFGALSDTSVVELLKQGRVLNLEQGEVLYRAGTVVSGFYVVLSGRIALYKQAEGCDVLTRYFCRGEQIGFDAMIAMHPRSCTAVAVDPTLVLEISNDQFLRLHQQHPADFGLLMINLSRELSREIALLEDVIGTGTGWIPETKV
jgi:CRP-like cAMP-binding protein